MHTHRQFTAILSAILFLAAGCVEETTIDDNGWTSDGVSAVISSNNNFALDLFSKFREESGNVFFSPYSISVALAMTYEGARGKTAEEMQRVLHIPENESERRPNFARMINEINKKDGKYTLSTANALWVQEGYKLLDEYLEVVERYYGGKATNLDFVREMEKSRRTINAWVEGQTNGKIVELLHQDDLTVDTVLVLTNAIYFKGRWLLQFDPEDTREEEFTTATGERIKVPMMGLTGEELNYAEKDGIQILEMAYEGEDLSMMLILPEDNDLESVEETLTPEKISEWKEALVEQSVDVFVPKFSLKTRYSMKDTLTDMGMPTAFSAGADLSGMNGYGGLVIGNVIHQAFIEVNEEGSEAAGATAVIVLRSVQKTPVFRADHPFIFLIQRGNNILFMGRVNDPTG